MSLQLDGEASGARGFAGAPSAPSWVTPCGSPTTSRECEQPIFWPARNANSAQSRCQDSAHRVTSLSGTMAAYFNAAALGVAVGGAVIYALKGKGTPSSVADELSIVKQHWHAAEKTAGWSRIMRRMLVTKRSRLPAMTSTTTATAKLTRIMVPTEPLPSPTPTAPPTLLKAMVAEPVLAMAVPWFAATTS